ncbi:hypothetical protein [Shimazuella kribbensis]|uniref:hypothetical protein n=1 Tax=Shimazuella kribbensis TaxID=139808 RepID=UPI00048AAB43|nr:hypothetical protein [Shimazuella kribbensis]
MRCHYIVEFLFEEKKYYCIWYTDDTDGILVESNKIKYFSTVHELRSYSLSKRLTLEDEVIKYDINQMIEWLSSDPRSVDCKMILEFWNIFSDVARSIDEHFYGEDEVVSPLYEKLFYGNNLDPINKSGHVYIPIWNNEEVVALTKVVESGLNLFRKSILQ